jgi:Domain of unknown function (DUF4184)
MPFTISHTAIVLPFSRLLARWRLLSATLIGAMVPDFRLFFPGMSRVETHSRGALFAFCLPVGLLTYWLFERLMKTPIVEMLPAGAYSRWQPYAAEGDFRSLRQWLLAVLGILAGAVSHLIWDGFTHEGGRGVRMFPVLDESIFDIGRRHVPGIYVLQDLSSLLGLAAVLAMLCYALRPGGTFPPPRRLVPGAERARWILFYVGAAIAFSAAFYIVPRLGLPSQHSIVGRVSDVAIASLRGLAAALLCVSLALQMRLRALRYRSSGPER